MIWLVDVCIEVYDVEETSAPDGYSLPEDEDQECEISENTDPEQQCTLTFVDPLGMIIIEKVDADNTDDKLAGAEFEITPNPFFCQPNPPSTADPLAVVDDTDAEDPGSGDFDDDATGGLHGYEGQPGNQGGPHHNP